MFETLAGFVMVGVYGHVRRNLLHFRKLNGFDVFGVSVSQLSQLFLKRVSTSLSYTYIIL